jgi:5-methylcytosine-specific restriction endonuclease McrBC GTP-binding regulatory subunit McrB
VILAGISGTGKSKLPELVSRLTSGNCVRVSVRPDWTDSSEVLGYIDLNDRFRPGRVLQLAHDAQMDPARYHVCLIDEMNLARVEHYFAEVLSAIEDRRPAANGWFETTALVAQKLPSDSIDWQEQVIPGNLGIVGTVNMDESSHGFSRKVLDRAFTIELSEVDLSLDANTSGDSNPSSVNWSNEYWKSAASRISEIDLSKPSNRMIAEKATSLLQEINRSLVHCQLQIGYRTRDEVVLFMIHAEEIRDLFRTRSGERVDPLDLAVMMKILPRLVGGSNAIRQTLLGLLGVAVEGQPFATEDKATLVVDKWVSDERPDLVDAAKLPRSAARLCLMWKRLEDGYTSYWL